MKNAIHYFVFTFFRSNFSIEKYLIISIEAKILKNRKGCFLDYKNKIAELVA
jgi:hypothetical protein